MATDNPVLIRHLVDFCEELLRANPIGVQDNTISSDDVRAQLTALAQHFRLAAERHEREPTFSSSLVISTMAVLLHDRAVGAASRPGREYQDVRRMLDQVLPSVVSGKSAAVANINLHLRQSSRTVDNLRCLAGMWQTLRCAVPANSTGVVLTTLDGDAYRFSAFVPATHTCRRPPEPRAELRVTLKDVTDTGRVSFTEPSVCECLYIADGLNFDRP